MSDGKGIFLVSILILCFLISVKKVLQNRILNLDSEEYLRWFRPQLRYDAAPMSHCDRISNDEYDF